MTAPPDSALDTQRLGLDPAVARAVAESLDLGAAEDAVSRVLALTPTDAARLIETLGAPERQALVEAARGRLDPEILSELDEHVRDEVVELLGPARTGRALGELEEAGQGLGQTGVAHRGAVGEGQATHQQVAHGPLTQAAQDQQGTLSPGGRATAESGEIQPASGHLKV